MRDKSVYLVLIAAGTAMLAWSATHVAWGQGAAWLFIAAFTALTIPLLLARVTLATQGRHYSLEDVAVYAICFTSASYAAPHWAIGTFVLFTASMLCELFVLGEAVRRIGLSKIKWENAFYNFTNPFAHVVYLSVAGSVYMAVNGNAAFLGSARNLLAIVATVLAYMAFTTAVDAVETMMHGGRVRSLLDIYSTLSLNIAMLAPLGVVLTLLWRTESLAIALLAVPVAVMHLSMKSVRSIVDDAQLAIETMMNALEARDAYTAGHSERVGRFAALIAARMRLSDEEVRRVANAGRIHDIGKIDIPDAILRKTCCLDDHEYGIMKTHTDRPMEYAQKYPRLSRHIPFYEAACHHEKFNGSGYVHGLQGEQIPLVARIISVADTWDAMTSDRPYRQGLFDTEALRRLSQASGTQFDPRVVSAFMQAYAAGEISRVMVEWKETDRFRQVGRETQLREKAGRRIKTVA